MRERVRSAAQAYVQTHRPTPPLSLSELQTHAQTMSANVGLERQFRDYAALLISNALWRDTVAGIPMHKRLLLLPRCLRDARDCPARCDEIGLLCEHCGRCVIDAFKRQAQGLGYAVLIAEGSPIVMSLIETGQIEAVIGVSCMTTLERVYPYMEAGAVPGIALPLLYDGCQDTAVDSDWVWEALYDTTEEQGKRLDLEALREKVQTWFRPAALREILPKTNCQTHSLALDWLCAHGKRWRPFLTTATHEVLDGHVPDSILSRIAVAVECFHKASLIHDDIEDGDRLRYGDPTLHAEYGVPIALNVGDYLLGEGYRLLAEADLPAPQRTSLVRIAAHGHRTLCLGQGRELTWSRRPCVLPVNDLLAIFRDKTAPAFDVALSIGATLAEADETTLTALQSFSAALGIAYQIRDDLDDLLTPDGDRQTIIRRPSILMSLAYAAAGPAGQTRLSAAVNGSLTGTEALGATLECLSACGVERRAADLLESYKSEAIAALSALHHAALKGLLRRVITKIFFDFDIMGCCNDPQT